MQLGLDPQYPPLDLEETEAKLRSTGIYPGYGVGEGLGIAELAQTFHRLAVGRVGCQIGSAAFVAVSEPSVRGRPTSFSRTGRCARTRAAPRVGEPEYILC